MKTHSDKPFRGRSGYTPSASRSFTNSNASRPRYATPPPLFSSSSSGHRYEIVNEGGTPDPANVNEGGTPDLATDAKEVEQSRRQALQVVLDYYINHEKLGSRIDDEWIMQRSRLQPLVHKYASFSTVQGAHFYHSQKLGSQ